MLHYTKTFAEKQYFQRARPVPGTGSDPQVAGWQAIHQSTKDTSLDDQIKAWVQETGNQIVNPGTLMLHRDYQVGEKVEFLCVTLGLVVLYVEPGETSENPGQA